MKTIARMLVLGLVLGALYGCEERTERTDSGGVLLEVELVDRPFVVSVNADDRVVIGEIAVNSIVASPTASTSQLMDIQLDAFEVNFERADSGTRLPPSFVRNLIGTVPVGGTLTLNDHTVMTAEQLRNPPLSDLLFENGGFDKETGSTNIKLNLVFRFFGRTLTGKAVESVPRKHTIEFRQ